MEVYLSVPGNGLSQGRTQQIRHRGGSRKLEGNILILYYKLKLCLVSTKEKHYQGNDRTQRAMA